MKIELAGITQSRIPGINTPDAFIGYCARVSNPNNQTNLVSMPKLLAYMIREQHWSPFEMVHVVLEITTTRDIGRQILRHRSFSFQEFSTRYAEVTGDFISREVRLQDKDNRQSSIATDDIKIITEWENTQEMVKDLSRDAYRWAVDVGIAKEVARSLLPEGLAPSTMYMAGTLRSWMHYVWLRSHPSTQKEHREIALGAAKLIANEFVNVPILNYICADQSQLLIFDPCDGSLLIDHDDVQLPNAVQFRKRRRAAWFFNPWTGMRRTPEEVGEDPFGYYIKL